MKTKKTNTIKVGEFLQSYDFVISLNGTGEYYVTYGGYYGKVKDTHREIIRQGVTYRVDNNEKGGV